MARVPLPASLAVALTAAKAPAICTCDDVRQSVAPLLQILTRVQMQVADDRAKLFAAEIEAPEVDGHTERLHQTLKALDADATAAITAIRRLILGRQQYARYAVEIGQQYTTSKEESPLPVPPQLGD